MIDAQTQATAANTDALAQEQPRAGFQRRQGGSDVLSTASSILGGGLSLMPLVSLFSSLFGGGQSQQPRPWCLFRCRPR